MFEPPPTEIERCPACEAARTIGRVQCTCGYSFESGFVEPLPVEDTPRRERSYAGSSRKGDGSLLTGVVLGFFCACFAPLVAAQFKLGRETIRGAWIGFGVSLVLTVVGNLLRAT